MKRSTKIITYVSAVIFLFSAFQLTRIGYDYANNRTILAHAQDVFERLTETHEDEDVAYLNERETVRALGGEALDDWNRVRPQFESLYALNEEIVGWIKVDGTPIDYPVLQGVDNDYYLYRNYKGQQSNAGSIFMDFRNDVKRASDKNTVLYGHRMKDETMFYTLTRFMDETFFNENRQIQWDTAYDTLDAEIFAVYQTTTDVDYIATDFETEADYAALLETIKEQSIFDSPIDVTTDDRMLTLSTCDYTLDPTEGRFVVHAKLIE